MVFSLLGYKYTAFSALGLTLRMCCGKAVRAMPLSGTLLVFLVLQRNSDLVEDAGLNVTSKPLYLCYQIAQVLT